jgi:hypothetical protein
VIGAERVSECVSGGVERRRKRRIGDVSGVECVSVKDVCYQCFFIFGDVRDAFRREKKLLRARAASTPEPARERVPA